MTASRFRGSLVVAVVVLVMGLGWVSTSKGSAEDIARPLALLLGGGGLIVAVGIWRGARWALRSYSIWALAAFIGFVVLDARVGPVFWKVAVAAAVEAAVLLGLGLLVHSRQATHLPEETRRE